MVEPLCKDVKINTKAGDFILFDSRTFHCSTKPTTPTLRVCTYICMLPEEKVANKVKEKRMKALENHRVTCHHPGDGFKTFPETPRYLDNREKFIKLIEKVNHCELDEEMKSLV